MFNFIYVIHFLKQQQKIHMLAFQLIYIFIRIKHINVRKWLRNHLA